MKTILQKFTMGWIPVFCVLLIANHVSAQSQKRVKGIQGQKAPAWDVEVESWHQLPDGKTELDISDYKGKVLYLYFFQSWCPGCHERGFPTLQKLHSKFKDDKQVEFAVIQTTFEGHRINTSSKLAATAKKYELPVPFGQSRGQSGTPDIMRKYRSGGTPWVVIIDKAGTVKFNDFHISSQDAAKLITSLK